MIDVSTLSEGDEVMVELADTHHWVVGEPATFPLCGKFRAVVVDGATSDGCRHPDELTIGIHPIVSATAYVCLSTHDPLFGFISLEKLWSS